jgi:hypothetical protein
MESGINKALVAEASASAHEFTEPTQFMYRDLNQPGKAGYVEVTAALSSGKDAGELATFVERGELTVHGVTGVDGVTGTTSYAALEHQVRELVIIFNMDFALINTVEFKAALQVQLQLAAVVPTDILAISLVEGSVVATVTLRTQAVSDRVAAAINFGLVQISGLAPAGSDAPAYIVGVLATTPTTQSGFDTNNNATTIEPQTVFDPLLDWDATDSTASTSSGLSKTTIGTVLTVCVTRGGACGGGGGGG